MALNVFITIDVESGEYCKNYNGSVWGELQNHAEVYYGLPLIIDLLEQVKLKAVFFVEALSALRHSVVNLQKICRFILENGHEVQLHIHPNHRHKEHKPGATLLLGKYPLYKQAELINLGIRILKECGVKNISCFRAGGFGIGIDTPLALEQCGILFDSSYDLNYVGSSCLITIPNPIKNDVFKINNIYEFPVTCFHTTGTPKNSYRHLQITACSHVEMKDTLIKAHYSGMANVTILLHSFEFIKYYNKERTLGRKNTTNINRFKKLLLFLAKEKKTFEVMGYNDISSETLRRMLEKDKISNIVPELPFIFKIIRQISQIRKRL